MIFKLKNFLIYYGVLQHQKFKINHYLLKNVILECINRGLTEFKPQSISNLCWSLATMDFYVEKFFNMVSTECVKRTLIPNFIPYTITILVVSFALFDFRHDRFFFMKLQHKF
jgi:hypothetical protein